MEGLARHNVVVCKPSRRCFDTGSRGSCAEEHRRSSVDLVGGARAPNYLTIANDFPRSTWYTFEGVVPSAIRAPAKIQAKRRVAHGGTCACGGSRRTRPRRRRCRRWRFCAVPCRYFSRDSLSLSVCLSLAARRAQWKAVGVDENNNDNNYCCFRPTPTTDCVILLSRIMRRCGPGRRGRRGVDPR